MKDKEKQIEEIKNIIVDYTEEYRLSCSKSTLAKMIYEKIIPKDSVVLTERELLDNCELNYDAGYKKALADLTKDSVVLSREEYEILTKDIEHPTDEVLKKLVVGKNILTEQVIEKTRKKTAEKILRVISDTHTENIGYTDWLDSFFGDKFQKLCEQYGIKAIQTKDGVEIKE